VATGPYANLHLDPDTTMPACHHSDSTDAVTKLLATGLMQEQTRNLSSHIDMHTHTSCTVHNPVTLTFYILTSGSMYAQLLPGSIHVSSLVLIVQTIFTRDSIYAIARICHSNSVRLSVHPSVRLSHGWISQKRLKLGSRNFHHTVAPSL